ncbi:MAG: hypothetical protein PHQ42_00270 [Patescibacteria group bacterium]|nr:hypothetical protein [Patescibacteria group bacterium]
MVLFTKKREGDMIDLNGIKMKNRFIVGSGPAKYGLGYELYENPLSFLLCFFHLMNWEIFGAVITKTLTLPPWKGNYRWWKPWEVLRPAENGWLNRFGWNNFGLDKFISLYPGIGLKNLVVSIGVFDLKDIKSLLWMLEMLNPLNILAIEINFSCPHVKILSRDDLRIIEDFMREARKFSQHPLIAKFGPTGDIIERVIIAEKCGFNAVSLINTVPQFVLGFGECGLSGRAIKPIALEVIRKVRPQICIPIFGGGGIYTADDCQEFFDAGADATVFVSVFFCYPLRPQKIVRSFLKTQSPAV